MSGDARNTRIGFMGMGVMGAPMAGHLARAGRDVTVWNRTPEKAARTGLPVADSPATLAHDCGVLILCVGGTDDVRDVLRQALEGAPPTLVIDHSTISPSGAREIAEELAKNGHRFVDAPVTGGSMGAQAGTLTIFLGGAEADCAEAKEIVAPYAKVCERVGPSGAGQTMKAANQVAVGGALAGLCESLALARRAGLDVEQAHRLIGAGAGGSWAFQNYGPKILDRDDSPGFAVRHQRKDFGYVHDLARELSLSLPATDAVDGVLAKAEADGHADATTAVIYRTLLGEPD